VGDFMDFKDVVKNRHSIREFSDKKVSRRILTKLLKDASIAPSADNEQPWFFYIVNLKKDVTKVKELAREYFNGEKSKYKKALSRKSYNICNNFYYNLGNCQAIIFVCTDKNNYNIENEISKNSRIMSIAASIENLLLSAVDNELGSCWIGFFNKIESKLQSKLKLSKDKKIIAGIIIGYPKDGYKYFKRAKKSISQISKFIE
jgi:nitroreductase